MDKMDDLEAGELSTQEAKQSKKNCCEKTSDIFQKIQDGLISKLYSVGQFLWYQGAEIMGTATDIKKAYTSISLGG